MKKIFLSLLIILLLSTGRSEACVGKVLNIGILNSVNENFLAELVSVLTNERTGTIVNIKVYSDPQEIYNAVKKDEVNIVIENTERALMILNVPENEGTVKAYNVFKEEFRNRLNLIWLKPFGMVDSEDGKGEYFYVPVITEYVLINFPALPKLINKLSDISADKNFKDSIKSLRSGEITRKAAKALLKKKKLI